MNIQQTGNQLLTEVLRQKASRNPRYTMRALARDLGVSHSYLSMVKHGTRKPSVNLILSLAKMHGLSSDHITQLMSECRVKRSGKRQSKPFVELGIAHFRTVTFWYYPAILDLTFLADFSPSPSWIAKRLSITNAQAKQAIEDLLAMGLLEREGSQLKKNQSFIAIGSDEKHSHQNIRCYHRMMIEKAMHSLESNRQKDFQRRDITGSMIAVNPARFAEAKKKIARFRRSLIRFLSEGDCTELYHLNVQLFPLSKGTPSSKETQ